MTAMSQDDPVAETPAVFPSPQCSGDNADLEIQALKCDICDKVFTRLEHLRRHRRSHSAEKPFACGECQKRFARRDILQRHRASHDFKRLGNASDGIRRYSRACFACASARVKCLRGNVCQRCRSRDLRCEYPSRRSRKRTPCQSTLETESLESFRTTSEEGEHGDERIAERNDDNSCIITDSGENRPNSEIFGSMPTEKTWASHLVTVASDPSLAEQTWTNSDSEVGLAAAGTVQAESPMGAGNQLHSENYINPNETIIPGAQLILQVSEGNIGSIYNYSGINWLSSNGLIPTDEAFKLPSLHLPKPSNANAHGSLSNESHIQSSERSATPGQFENSYIEPYDNSRHSGSTSSNKPVSLGRLPSVTTVGTSSTAPMYYVNEYGAGLSIPSRQKQQNRSALSPFGGQGSNSLSPPTYDDLGSNHAQYTHEHIWFPEEAYISLTDYLKYTPGWSVSLLHTETFPSLKELNEFVRLYFDAFHGSFPLLHQASFLNSRDGCLLELAMSAIGACYVGTFHARKCSESLHELVHTLLEIATASNYNPSAFHGVFGFRKPEHPQPLVRLQARILNVLGMFQSGNSKLERLAREDRAILVTACMESRMLISNHYDGWQAARDTEEEGERFLQKWLEGELNCRAGYFVWMLDCMTAYESDFRTHMDLSDGKAPLPCPEQIWNEPILNKTQVLILNNGPPSLCFALDVLYTEKRLVPNLGELSRILLIHGMYRRVWEVTRCRGDHLSDWVPTALSEPRYGITSGKAIAPPSIPVVSRWINGSSDCLDVLHWSAKSTILQASGLEHPTVLHLHLSRLILLAPVSDLQELAKLKQESRSRSESNLYSAMQEQSRQNSLLKWVVHDQYKARLAIIHAGSVFWYLRRYSCGAVIEPFANYLATLVLWTYSISISAAKPLANSPPSSMTYELQGVDGVQDSRGNVIWRHNQDGYIRTWRPNAEEHTSSDYYNSSPPHRQISSMQEQLESHETSLIQLDRPCDDELVQLFVRSGERMTPYMARVGDIKSRDSAGKILREGIKLLSRQGTGSRRNGSERLPNFIWGAAENFISMLSALGAASSQDAIAIIQTQDAGRGTG